MLFLAWPLTAPEWNDSATLRTLRAHFEVLINFLGLKGGLSVIVDRLIVPVI